MVAVSADSAIVRVVLSEFAYSVPVKQGESPKGLATGIAVAHVASDAHSLSSPNLLTME